MTRSEALLVFVGTNHTTTSALTSAVLAQDGVDHGRTHRWSLSTKYYDADICVQLLDVDDHSVFQPDACVLVVDAALGESLSRVQHWWEAKEVDGSSVRVLAVCGAEEGDPSLEAARAWCADQLVELVAVPPAPGDETLSLANEGVARIHEALQAHMWPGLRLKPSPRHDGAAWNAAEMPVEEEQPGLPFASESNPFLEGGRDDAPWGRDADGFASALQLVQGLEGATDFRGSIAGLAPERRQAAAEELIYELMELLGISEDDEQGSEEDGGVHEAEDRDDVQRPSHSQGAEVHSAG